MSVYSFAPFKNSSFGETITYTPSGGAATQIKAVVFRNGAQKMSLRQGADVAYFPIVAEIDREDISAITLQEDKITCQDANGVQKTFRVMKIMASDEGCFKLGLGA